MNDTPTVALLKKYNLSDTFWGKRIIRAEQKKRFSVADHDLSAGWTTCACGKLSSSIPRNAEGKPHDTELSRLGAEFDMFMFGNDFYKVAYRLVLIEARAKELLTEVLETQ